MKTNSNLVKFSGKLIIVFLIITCFNSQPVKAQGKFAVCPGIGIGIGIFNPAGVNEFIADDLSDYITTNAELYMYEEVRASLGFKMKWLEVTPLIEYAFGPKIVVGADKSYFFNRLSPGVTADFFIPMGVSGKHALFLGAGSQYHMMSFKTYSANTLGYKFQIGVDLQFGIFNFKPALYFNIAKAENVLEETYDNRDLNYTGGGISLNFSFHKPVLH